MRSLYIITDSSVTLEYLFERIKDVPDNYNIVFEDQIIAIEIVSPYGKYEFIKIEQETFEALLDEWYEDNKIFDLLLHNPKFNGRSNAFYIKFSRTFPDSELLKYLIQCLILCHDLDFIIYDCLDSLYTPSEFHKLLNP
ncbi:hypothetical protein HG66A1_54940 [Gimesia chilikensis]|uniref:Uncharacterized protein n=1 Tax=Gimesia chilikensis TaxID=2605989 RepID=A0A517PWC3_9PLAN|nr:hypothetical protein HG66A1_54940 [Gimesia chilikensis]